MIDYTSLKPCSVCGISKPLSEYYFRKRKGDDTPYPWCKECHKNKNDSNPLRNNQHKQPVLESEIRAINVLRKNGIFATSGKASEFKRMDIVAWGCIGIEVKTATLDAQGYYTFPFSFNQIKRGSQASFFMLVILPLNLPPSFHLFPSWHPIFYKDGKLRGRLSYKPNSRTFLSDKLMAEYKDAWHLIEEKRIEISQRLETGRLIVDFG